MLVEKILEAATQPVDLGIDWTLNPKVFRREVYVSNGMPPTVTADVMVLSKAPQMLTVDYVPEKIVEFDFWNEFVGFVRRNNLKVVDYDEYTPATAYIVDIKDMTLYKRNIDVG